MSRFRVRTLIVDDNARFLRAIREALNVIPWVDVIGTATSAEEAVAFLREAQLELVLMDVKLPGIDGFEATRRIRAEYPSIRTVILTLAASPEYERAAAEAGASGFLAKTETGRKLLSLLENIFKTDRGTL